jgi:type I restriction enzyme S subunit
MSGEDGLLSGWVMKTIGEVAEVVGGSTPKTGEPSYWGGDIAWITPNDLSGYDEKYISHGERFITESGYGSCSTKLLPPNAVLFTSRAPIGYTAITQNEVCTNQGFKSFICGPDVYPDYVYWYLKSATELARSMASGTTFRELSGKAAEKLPIPVPPLGEQLEIVAEIEKQMPRLDAANVALKRTIVNLERCKASVFQMGSRGLLLDQDPSDEPADSYLSSIGVKPLDQTPDQPIGWCLARLGDLVSVGSGATPVACHQLGTISRLFLPPTRDHPLATN